MTEVIDEINEAPAVCEALASFRAGALQSRNGKVDRRTQAKENPGAPRIQPSPVGTNGTRDPGILAYYLNRTGSVLHPALHVLHGRAGEDSQGRGNAGRVDEISKVARALNSQRVRNLHHLHQYCPQRRIHRLECQTVERMKLRLAFLWIRDVARQFSGRI